MSNGRLQKGIYQLFEKAHGEWQYPPRIQNTAIPGGKGQLQQYDCQRIAPYDQVYIIYLIGRFLFSSFLVCLRGKLRFQIGDLNRDVRCEGRFWLVLKQLPVSRNTRPEVAYLNSAARFAKESS